MQIWKTPPEDLSASLHQYFYVIYADGMPGNAKLYAVSWRTSDGKGILIPDVGDTNTAAIEH